MKIRQGFVSNSSSASYTVNIAIDKDCFFGQLMNEYDWSLFSRDKIEKEVKKDLKDYKKMQKDDEKKRIDNSEVPIFDYDDHIKKIESNIEELKKIDKDIDREELVRFVLKYNNIDINKATDEEVQLEYYTIMHNDFNEGINDLLKEIVMYFSFETTNKVRCEIKHEN